MKQSRRAFEIASSLTLLAMTVITGPCLWAQVPVHSRQRLLVSVPVADIRSEPRNYVLTGEPDPEEETQVLYGEILWADRQEKGWWHVEAPWQPSFRYSKAWQGYPGWIKNDFVVRAPSDWPNPTVVVISPQTSLNGMALSLGTELVAGPAVSGWMEVRCVEGPPGQVRASDVRFLKASMMSVERQQCIISEAGRLLRAPYLWGGLSAAGIDCSGLVHLAYRACGMTVPRDAREQKMKAALISSEELAPGDLIFSMDPKNPGAARHVAIYAGDNEIIEAPSTGLRVRRISVKEKYGRTLQELRGEKAGGRVVSFGRFIHE